MRLRHALFSIVIFLFTPTVFAQSPQAKFTTKTEVVLVPAVVTDKGQPVTGLTIDDFEITDNGKPQKLVSFDPPELRARPAPERPSATATDFSNMDEAPPRRLTIIALDTQNLAPGSGGFARDAVTRFLNTALASDERVAVITLQSGGFQVIHDFSRDSGSLRRAIDKARLRANLSPLQPMGVGMQSGGAPTPPPLSNPDAADTSDPVEAALRTMEGSMKQTQAEINEAMTADSMRAVAQRYGPIPGRKSLVWVTDSFPKRMDLPVLASAKQSAEAGRGTNTNNFASVFLALNDANIAVYPIDARGLVAFIPDDAGSMVSNGSGATGAGQMRLVANQVQENIDTMTWFAAETGGKAFYNRNSLVRSLNEVFSQADATYLLTYRLPGDAKKGWHALDVKVKQPGAKVTSRKGFFVGNSTQRTPENELTAAATTPFNYTGLPLMVRWTTVKPGGNGKSLATFQFAIPGGAMQIDKSTNNRVELGLLVVATNADGKKAGDLSRIIAANLNDDSAAKVQRGGFSYSGQLELPPGEYTVKFGVRDAVTGRLGSVDTTLNLK